VARAAQRRLPGVRFEAWAPPLADVLPRMDVAAFVGFAASGPLHQPVAVEDVGHLADLFGDDAPLAWDPDRSEPVRAHLAPAVRAFFRNGGARCLVVRVAAATARANRFSLPGILRCAGGALRPANARARSEGSWSDPLRVGAAAVAEVLPVMGWTADGGLALIPPPGAPLASGDLVRVTFPEIRLQLVLPVTSVAGPPPGADPRTAVAPAAGALWFDLGLPPGPPPATARCFTADGAETTLPVINAQPAMGTTDQAVVTLAAAPAAAPPPGTLLRLEGAAERWFRVEHSDVPPGAGSAATAVVLQGTVVTPRAAPAALPSTAGARGERLRLDLWGRRGSGEPSYAAGLGYLPAHPRAWEALPVDADLFAEDGGPAPSDPGDAQAALRDEMRFPRFPLAGPGPALDEGAFSFPVGEAVPRDDELGCGAESDDAPARDGLEAFAAEIFLDPALAPLTTETLLAEADFLRHQSPAPRRLLGLHALLACEEITLVAVPDAVHRPWGAAGVTPPPPPAAPAAPEPLPAGFRACDLVALDAPAFLQAGPADTTGTFPLAWTPLPGAVFTLEEATRPGFEDAVLLHEGPEDGLEIRGRAPGAYYYRVRAAVGASQSGWSAGAVVAVAPPVRQVLLPLVPGAPAVDLLVVQRALVRVCAVRGDLLALLSLPVAYGPDDAIRHAGLLASPPAGEPGVPALSFGEQHDLSFAALHHPWLVEAPPETPGDLRREPPDGAMSGVYARRALERGAWVAPANQPLQAIVDLDPRLPEARLLDLQDAQVNVLRQEPRGFLALAADTLAAEPDFVPVSARRLLALLRRVALRLGPTYVFEPNDGALRRMVQRGFEEVLGDLHARGAFAGRDAAGAYQVVAGSPEAPDAAERGLFFVELRVAPSLPMRFVTVRLVQGGEGSAVAEVT